MADRPKTTDEADALTSTINSLTNTVSTLTRTVDSLVANPPSTRTDAQRFERPGLSKATTNVTDVSAEAAAISAKMDASGAATSDAPTQTGLGHAMEAYARYVALFVGAGLISGSIVHFPLDPARYVIVGIIGAVLFSGASALGDIRTNGLSRSTVRIVIASAALSLGIGMMSGGIQHFEDFPDRAAVLIPVGIVISVVAFLVRQLYRLTGQHLMWLAAGGLWVVLIVGFGLHGLANGISESTEPGGHSHEAAPTATEPSSKTAPPTTVADSATHGH